MRARALLSICAPVLVLTGVLETQATHFLFFLNNTASKPSYEDFKCLLLQIYVRPGVVFINAFNLSICFPHLQLSESILYTKPKATCTDFLCEMNSHVTFLCQVASAHLCYPCGWHFYNDSGLYYWQFIFYDIYSPLQLHFCLITFSGPQMFFSDSLLVFSLLNTSSLNRTVFSSD